MLREDVVGAAAQGQFHIHAVSDVDEAIALLTGLPAGERSTADGLADGTLNHLVAARLEQFSLARQAFGTGQPPRPPRSWRKRPAVRRPAAR
jgi:predicted ATP-dependent protease